MKTKDTEVLGRQRAKPSKIKARYSRPTYKNCSSLCTVIIVHNTVTQRQFLITFLQNNITTVTDSIHSRSVTTQQRVQHFHPQTQNNQ